MTVKFNAAQTRIISGAFNALAKRKVSFKTITVMVEKIGTGFLLSNAAATKNGAGVFVEGVEGLVEGSYHVKFGEGNATATVVGHGTGATPEYRKRTQFDVK